MKTYFKIIRYIYLAIAILLTVETILTWGQNLTQTIIFGALAVMGYFMFFFKGWHGKQIEKENKQR